MWRWLSLTSLLLVGVTLFFILLWREHRQNLQYNVVILTVESLRRDLVTAGNTPHLLAAAEQGGRLANHLAVSGWTGANIVSLLTGLSPFSAGVHTRGQSVAPEYYLPLEQLADRGYSVEGVQGFMTMDLYKNLGLSVVEPGADLLYWLAAKQVAARPFFLWYHYLHTHLPYAPLNKVGEEGLGFASPDEQTRERFLAVANQPAIHVGEFEFTAEDTVVVGNMHAAAVRDFDRWFAQFWEYFVQSGLFRNTILILTADHGDEHGERGLVGHASTTLAGHLHREVIELPFFYWLPARLQQEGALHEPPLSSHIDIMPSLLAALGLEPAEKLPGNNLFAERSQVVWTGMTSSGGFAERDPQHIEYFMYGVQQGKWKLLWKRYASGAGEVYLYDTVDDEREMHNLAPARPDKVRAMQAVLEPLIARQVMRPVFLQEKTEAAAEPAGKLCWIFPRKGGRYSYNQLRGKFRLEWNGVMGQDYRIQYVAGRGMRKLSGELEAQGPVKDFGVIGRRYWNTWIVPYSPFKIRVAAVGTENWSDWLVLEAAR